MRLRQRVFSIVRLPIFLLWPTFCVHLLYQTTMLKSKKVERITSSAVSIPSVETPPTSHQLSRSKMPAQIPGERSLSLSFKQVQKATRRFSPSLKLSESQSWEVYKGNLPNNQIVVVRRAKKDSARAAKVHKEVQLLAAIKNHWSLVRFLCFIDKGNQFIMISEYVPNGSLKQHLHGQHYKILDLDQRILIAIDVAIALTYLHLSAAGETMICHDLKTTKILLTESYRAKLGTFELSRSGTMDNVIGTYGYIDPQYIRYSELTAKSDVYSFGVILLEIISSRGPHMWFHHMRDSGIFDNQPDGYQIPGIATWALERFRAGHISEILDDRLADHVDKKFLGDWLGLASWCTSLEVDDRPKIEEVGERLWEIWKDNRNRTGEPYEYERSWEEFVEVEGIPRGIDSIDKSSGYVEFPAEGRVTKHQDCHYMSSQQYQMTQYDALLSPPLSPR